MKIIQKFASAGVARLELKEIGVFLLRRLLINFNVPVLKSGIQRLSCTDNSFVDRPMAVKKNSGLGALASWRLVYI
jgi:hypothetical protein